MSLMDLLSQCMTRIEEDNRIFIEVPTREDIKVEDNHRNFLRLNNYRIQKSKSKLFLVRMES